MTDLQGILLVGGAIVLALVLSVVAAMVSGGRRDQAMIANENRRRLTVIRRYFDDEGSYRVFRDERGTIMSVHRQTDGAAVIFDSEASYAGHVYTGPGHAS
jgi:hypothetical protein